MQKTILLADDDPAVRWMLCRVLAEENYRVIPVDDAEEAVKKFKEFTVDLVLLDLTKAGVSTSDSLLKRFRNERPSVPVILISSQPKSISALDSDNDTRMEKPLDVCNLLRAIKKLTRDNVEA